MIPCDCTETHVPRRVVVTGGPGAGKTAALELIRPSSFCKYLQILPRLKPRKSTCGSCECGTRIRDGSSWMPRLTFSRKRLASSNSSAPSFRSAAGIT